MYKNLMTILKKILNFQNSRFIFGCCLLLVHFFVLRTLQKNESYQRKTIFHCLVEGTSDHVRVSVSSLLPNPLAREYRIQAKL